MSAIVRGSIELNRAAIEIDQTILEKSFPIPNSIKGITTKEGDLLRGLYRNCIVDDHGNLLLKYEQIKTSKLSISESKEFFDLFSQEISTSHIDFSWSTLLEKFHKLPLSLRKNFEIQNICFLGSFLFHYFFNSDNHFAQRNLESLGIDAKNAFDSIPYQLNDIDIKIAITNKNYPLNAQVTSYKDLLYISNLIILLIFYETEDLQAKIKSDEDVELLIKEEKIQHFMQSAFSKKHIVANGIKNFVILALHGSKIELKLSNYDITNHIYNLEKCFIKLPSNPSAFECLELTDAKGRASRQFLLDHRLKIVRLDNAVNCDHLALFRLIRYYLQGYSSGTKNQEVLIVEKGIGVFNGHDGFEYEKLFKKLLFWFTCHSLNSDCSNEKFIFAFVLCDLATTYSNVFNPNAFWQLLWEKKYCDTADLKNPLLQILATMLQDKTISFNNVKLLLQLLGLCSCAKEQNSNFFSVDIDHHEFKKYCLKVHFIGLSKYTLKLDIPLSNQIDTIKNFPIFDHQLILDLFALTFTQKFMSNDHFFSNEKIYNINIAHILNMRFDDELLHLRLLNLFIRFSLTKESDKIIVFEYVQLIHGLTHISGKIFDLCILIGKHIFKDESFTLDVSHPAHKEILFEFLINYSVAYPLFADWVLIFRTLLTQNSSKNAYNFEFLLKIYKKHYHTSISSVILHCLTQITTLKYQWQFLLSEIYSLLISQNGSSAQFHQLLSVFEKKSEFLDHFSSIQFNTLFKHLRLNNCQLQAFIILKNSIKFFRPADQLSELICSARYFKNVNHQNYIFCLNALSNLKENLNGNEDAIELFFDDIDDRIKKSELEAIQKIQNLIAHTPLDTKKRIVLQLKIIERYLKSNNLAAVFQNFKTIIASCSEEYFSIIHELINSITDRIIKKDKISEIALKEWYELLDFIKYCFSKKIYKEIEMLKQIILFCTTSFGINRAHQNADRSLFDFLAHDTSLKNIAFSKCNQVDIEEFITFFNSFNLEIKTVENAHLKYYLPFLANLFIRLLPQLSITPPPKNLLNFYDALIKSNQSIPFDDKVCEKILFFLCEKIKNTQDTKQIENVFEYLCKNENFTLKSQIYSINILCRLLSLQQNYLELSKILLWTSKLQFFYLKIKIADFKKPYEISSATKLNSRTNSSLQLIQENIFQTVGNMLLFMKDTTDILKYFQIISYFEKLNFPLKNLEIPVFEFIKKRISEHKQRELSVALVQFPFLPSSEELVEPNFKSKHLDDNETLIIAVVSNPTISSLCDPSRFSGLITAILLIIAKQQISKDCQFIWRFIYTYKEYLYENRLLVIENFLMQLVHEQNIWYLTVFFEAEKEFKTDENYHQEIWIQFFRSLKQLSIHPQKKVLEHVNYYLNNFQLLENVFNKNEKNKTKAVCSLLESACLLASNEKIKNKDGFLKNIIKMRSTINNSFARVKKEPVFDGIHIDVDLEPGDHELNNLINNLDLRLLKILLSQDSTKNHAKNIIEELIKRPLLENITSNLAELVDFMLEIQDANFINDFILFHRLYGALANGPQLHHFDNIKILEYCDRNIKRCNSEEELLSIGQILLNALSDKNYLQYSKGWDIFQRLLLTFLKVATPVSHLKMGLIICELLMTTEVAKWQSKHNAELLKLRVTVYSILLRNALSLFELNNLTSDNQVDNVIKIDCMRIVLSFFSGIEKILWTPEYTDLVALASKIIGYIGSNCDNKEFIHFINIFKKIKFLIRQAAQKQFSPKIAFELFYQFTKEIILIYSIKKDNPKVLNVCHELILDLFEKDKFIDLNIDMMTESITAMINIYLFHGFTFKNSILIMPNIHYVTKDDFETEYFSIYKQQLIDVSTHIDNYFKNVVMQEDQNPIDHAMRIYNDFFKRISTIKKNQALLELVKLTSEGIVSIALNCNPKEFQNFELHFKNILQSINDCSVELQSNDLAFEALIFLSSGLLRDYDHAKSDLRIFQICYNLILKIFGFMDISESNFKIATIPLNDINEKIANIFDLYFLRSLDFTTSEIFLKLSDLISLAEKICVFQNVNPNTFSICLHLFFDLHLDSDLFLIKLQKIITLMVECAPWCQELAYNILIKNEVRLVEATIIPDNLSEVELQHLLGDTIYVQCYSSIYTNIINHIKIEDYADYNVSNNCLLKHVMINDFPSTSLKHQKLREAVIFSILNLLCSEISVSLNDGTDTSIILINTQYSWIISIVELLNNFDDLLEILKKSNQLLVKILQTNGSEPTQIIHNSLLCLASIHRISDNFSKNNIIKLNSILDDFSKEIKPYLKSNEIVLLSTLISSCTITLNFN